jgi:hypothetical protein
MKSDRQEQEKMMQKMRDLARTHPEKICIIETSVDSKIQIEFFETLQKLENKLNRITEIVELKDNLYNPEISIKEKKEILALLAGLGEVESYRIIEEYLKDAEKELKSWTFLSYQQAKLFLESKLLEETKIYIASGLGGNEHRLRYSFAVNSTNPEFDQFQKDTVKGELEYFLKKENCILEELYFDKKFAVATALVPVYSDLVDLLQEIILEINQYGEFLEPNVFITNEKKIDISELINALSEQESD